MFKCCSVVIYIPFLFFCILLLFLGLIYQPPWTTYALKLLFPSGIIHFDRNCQRKSIVLTIDDGPNDHLLDILEALEETNSTATFFLTGSKIIGLGMKLYNYEMIIKPLLEGGNDIGHHMYDYKASFLLSKEEFNETFRITDEILSEEYWKNNKKKWFRPSSFISLPWMKTIYEELNYTLVLGNIHSFDSQIRKTGYNLFNLIGRIQTGDIIIVHAIEESVDYIVQLIYYLNYKGFEIHSLSSMVNICDYNN